METIVKKKTLTNGKQVVIKNVIFRMFSYTEPGLGSTLEISEQRLRNRRTVNVSRMSERRHYAKDHD
jgi:hypothetical protein